MNVIKIVLGALLVGLAGAAHSSAEQRVGDFALLDETGRFHQLSYYGDHRAVVIVAQANAAAELPAAVAALREAQQAEDVLYFMLNPGLDSRADVAEANGSGVPVLMDDAQLVAESLDLSRVGEAVVIDPATMKLAYRGDVAGAGQALAALRSGAALPASSVPGDGAPIEFASRQQHAAQAVSYTNDIVPILEENCVACHREGGIGPWAMNSHLMVQGFAPMIREVLQTRRMPPGQIDTHVGRPLAEVAGLTADARQKLVHWIDAGAPRDGDEDPLTRLKFADSKFAMGEPDMIFKVAAQDIPATGIIDYRYIPVQLNLDRDVWVRAVEFVPGDAEVLHHVIAYLSSPADKTGKGRASGADRGEQVAGFAPGRGPDVFAEGTGRLIPKGSNLLLQMHYTTSGRETVDETLVGLYLHDKPPQYVMSTGVAGQRRFLVPPGEKEYKLEGVQEIERDAYLYSMTPHMHFRGKYMSYTAEYPDGSSEVLLSVPKYDFNWQFAYELTEPVFLPAGTRLLAKGAMDNSDRNPANPDPTVPVHFGLQTKHEMFFGFTTLRYEGDTPDALAAGEPTTRAEAEAVDAAGD